MKDDPRGKEMRKLLTAALALALLGAGAGAGAGAEGGDTRNLQVSAIMPGLGNKYRSGAFFPVAVELGAQFAAESGTITIEASGSGDAVPRYTTRFELSPGTRYRYFLYPYCSNVGDSYVLYVRDAGGRTVRREELSMKGHDQQSYLVGIVGPQGIPGVIEREADNKACGMTMAIVAPDFMPPKACGYELLDVLIWAHPDPEGLTPTQINALEEWVLGGGRLVIAPGDTWQPTAATFLAGLAPGVVTGVESTGDLGALEAAGAAPFGPGSSMALTLLERPTGRVLMSAGGRPLVVRGKVGFGEVTFLAFDPTRNPFARWAGAQKFWDYLLGLGFPAEEGGTSGGTGSSPGGRGYGYQYRQGLAERLTGSMNQFTEIRPISFVFVVGFLIVYVILVGPVDYFVLKKLRHLEWTWITFPTIAVAATLVAFAVISATRAARVYINQLTVVDWSADGRMERTETISALISPKNDRYDVSYRKPSCELFLAEPAAGRYGMPSFSFTTNYDVVDSADAGMSALQVLMPVCSPRTFWGRWRTGSPGEPPLVVDLKPVAQGLEGSVTNNSAVAFDNVQLVHEKGVCKIGRLAAGESATINWQKSLRFADFMTRVNSGTDGSGSWKRNPRAFRYDAEPLVMAASVGADSRYYPAENVMQWQKWDQFGGGHYVYDLASEMSLRTLIDSGQAIVIGVCEDNPSPLDAGVTAPERVNWTIHRVCAAVSER